ncbi:hypothetical protein AC249_AIPGENE1155 [Exaiptasia diaphana]|nr:hypothetical protein AC249_AIPGENE1155 [Exaiptasia diaphana]
MATKYHEGRSHSGLSRTPIVWQFNLSRAPWWGGQFERLVGIVKLAPYKSIGRGFLNWNELEELMLDIEVSINNRPLSYVEDDDDVCEHFGKECFIKPIGGQRRRLKQGSVPSKFSFIQEKPGRKKPCYRAQQTNTVKQINNPVEVRSNSDTSMTDEIGNNSEAGSDIGHAADGNNSDLPYVDVERELPMQEKYTRLLNEFEAMKLEMTNKIKELEKQIEEDQEVRKELELQLIRGKFSIETVKDNDKLLKFYTSFENYKVFSMVLDFLGRDAASNLDYKNKNTEQKNYTYKPGPSRVFSVENEFFMVLCRLKVGLLEEDLAARFGVAQSTVSSIINTWIKFIFYRFRELDVFPPREIVQLHMPECFKKKYPSTTLIIDATEIFIEKPNNPEAQQLTFSSYKNANTLKALVGIVPKGGISFVSTLFGGSISDKELTEKSGLIDKLQRNDVIMADRGFNISNLLAEKGVKVNIPPFMNVSGQFEESELLETRRIATLRIHVERAMERIKNFHILDFIPITLCRNGIIDMIFFVCAMLSNFQKPLVNG